MSDKEISKQDIITRLASMLADEGYVKAVKNTDSVDLSGEDFVKLGTNPITHAKSYPGSDISSISEEYSEVKNLAKEYGANYVCIKTETYTTSDYLQRITEADIYAHVGDEEIQALDEMDLKVDFETYNAASRHLGLNLNLDYVELYSEHTQDFIDFFVAASQNQREDMIRKTFIIDKRNLQVDSWLSENYKDLLREVTENMDIK